MTNINHLKRTAVLLIGIISLVNVFIAIQAILAFTNTTLQNISPAVSISVVVGWGMVLMAMGISIYMLVAVKKGDTPFSTKFVTSLKALALLLIVYEPFVFIAQYLTRTRYPIFVGYIEGEHIMITNHPTFVGLIMAVGLVVYCVSHIFKYGISLQNQVDETL